MTEWKIGVFRPLLHVPTEFVIDFRGATLVMGLCGSFAYANRDPADVGLDLCSTCVAREQKSPRPSIASPSNDGWPADLKSLIPS
jgi:hypothetical protein